MTTLLQRCHILESKIKSLGQAKSLADDLAHVEQRTREWQVRHSKWMDLRAKIAPLSFLSEDASTVASKRGTFRKNAQTVLSRLLENDNIRELTRDAAWTRLLQACEGLTEALDVAGRKAWQAHLEQLGTLEEPTALRLRTPPTPSNEEALQDYRDSYSAFATLNRVGLPRSPDDLAQASFHVASCRQAFARLTFDLPDEVKTFYEAIHAGTANLTHVTPTVTRWLSEQGHLERFRVRSAGQ